MRATLLTGAWLGLFAGLIEGPLAIALRETGHLREVGLDILWTAPIVDAVLAMGAAGSLAAVATLVRRPQHTLRWAMFGSAFLTASVWLGMLLPYQVHTWALLLLSAGIATVFSRWGTPRWQTVLPFFGRTIRILVAATALAALVLRPGGWLLEAWRTARLPAAASDLPDVVVVVIDALRADHVHGYGYPRATTPVIDSIATDGATFLAAFSPAPYTAPSHASLLTGLLPSQHHVQWLSRPPVLSGEFPTLPEHLQRLGYRTGAFSANRFWFTREQGFGRGFLHFEDRYRTAGDLGASTAYGRKIVDIILKRWLLDYPWRRHAGQITDSFLEWARRAPSGAPIFAFLNYFDVHDPYLPPAPFDTVFGSGPASGLINSFRGEYEPDLTAGELQSEIDAYDGAVRYVDQEVRRLLAGLGERNRNGTLLIITSDHGEAFGEHGTYVHANSLYREEIHVPLILVFPGHIPAGFRSDQAVSIASLPATVLDLLADESKDVAMAPSLVPIWRDSATAAHWPAPISQMEPWPWMGEASPSHYGAMTSVEDERYHYIAHDSLGVSLFDWRNDPREQIDLAGQGAYADVLLRFAAEIRAAPGQCDRRRENCWRNPAR